MRQSLHDMVEGNYEILVLGVYDRNKTFEWKKYDWSRFFFLLLLFSHHTFIPFTQYNRKS